MAGMLIAVAATLLLNAPVPQGQFLPAPTSDDLTILAQILGAIGIGAVIGLFTARKIAMTDMPQLVAAFHSLVGMAAVLVAAAAFLNPEAFRIVSTDGMINPVSRIEMGLGIAIGAITFSGSVIAFLKLAGKMSGPPIILPLRHEDIIRQQAKEKGVPADLIAAVIYEESKFQDQTSSAGARAGSRGGSPASARSAAPAQRPR